MGLKCIKMFGEFSIGNEYEKEKLNCHLRKAQWEDMDMLFHWANDREVRENSFSMKPITYEEHVAWFKKKLGGESQIYILEQEDEGIGTLRLDFEGNEATISYSVAAEHRKKGYGTVLIRLAEENVSHGTLMKAYVKKENEASNKIFQKLGYKRDGTQYMKWIE